MEERIIDDPRKIKVKKNAVGGIEDVTDELAPETQEFAEEEIELTLPGEEFEDEDLIGLAPSQLKKELERREKEAAEARAERDRLLSEGDSRFKAGDYEGAEPFFAQALVYDADCRAAKEGVWTCRTRNFSQIELLFNRKTAVELAESDDVTRAFVLKHAGAELEAERKAAEEEAAPLREKVHSAQAGRRGAFLDNRNYYLMRFAVFAFLFVLFAIAAGVSATFIVRTQGIVPLVLVAVFGVIAFAALAVAFVYLRKLVVAQRLVSANEKLSSTEDGAHLARLEERLEVLSLLIDGEE